MVHFFYKIQVGKMSKYKITGQRNFAPIYNVRVLGMKILVVEDDKTIASGLEYMLQQEGYGTILCANAKAAKTVLAEQLTSIDLCLFDLSLPDGSGYDLCALVKKLSDKPVTFLTAFDDEVNIVRGLDMGADDYITKPFRIRELLSRIKSVLRRYQQQTTTQPKRLLK